MKINKNFIVGLMASSAFAACQKENLNQGSSSSASSTSIDRESKNLGHNTLKSSSLIEVLIAAEASIGALDTIRVPVQNANLVLAETKNSQELALQFQGLNENNEIEFRIVDNKSLGQILTFREQLGRRTVEPKVGDAVSVESVSNPVAAHQTIRLLSVVPLELAQLLADIDSENA